jgi:hypothetical protein
MSVHGSPVELLTSIKEKSYILLTIVEKRSTDTDLINFVNELYVEACDAVINREFIEKESPSYILRVPVLEESLLKTQGFYVSRYPICLTNDYVDEIFDAIKAVITEYENFKISSFAKMRKDNKLGINKIFPYKT